jgi:transposase InsO family protein
VTRQGYYRYVATLTRPSKDKLLLAQIHHIYQQDEENGTYGVIRMQEALDYLYGVVVGKRRLQRIMHENGWLQRSKRKPNGLTRADKAAQKSDNLLGGDFTAERPNEKVVTDMTEVPAKDGKLYVSAAFDCYDQTCVGLAMGTSMKTDLVLRMVEQMTTQSGTPLLIHSDRGSQYTSHAYREALQKRGIQQSMNSAGGRCHDNAKCESMWARFKEEKIYRMDTKSYTVEQLKVIVFRYFMGYWNHRRICSAIGGVPPIYKRQRYWNKQNHYTVASFYVSQLSLDIFKRCVNEN